VGNQYIESIVKAQDHYPEKDFGSQAHLHFDDAGELYRITDAYCLVGLFEEACTLYKRIIELNPAWIDVLDPYARALWALHDYEEAKKMWTLFLEKRKSARQKIGIPLNFYTVDDVFTSAFGNFTHFYPMDKYGYLSDKDEFYYHPSDGKHSSLPAHHRKPVCNEALRKHVFERIKDNIPPDILLLLAQDDYVTRLPFYCATDLNRQPTHFHPAFAEKMLSLNRAGAAARIRFEPEQIDDCEQRLARMGVEPNRPIVCIHARESGYWGRTGDLTHSTKNADIASYIPAIQFLTDNGYQVVRLGDPSMRPLPALKFAFDYAHSEHKSDFLDLYLLTRSTFTLCTSSGPFTVASMFNIPVLATNWVSAHTLPFLPRDLILFKKFKYRDSGKLLSFRELLNLDYGEFSYYNLERKNIEVVDNTPAELLSATTEMLEKLHAKKKVGLVDRAYRPLKAAGARLFHKPSRFHGKAIISEAQFARDSIYAA
jgi:putative glycosyltransferase (TIGR04372 family)